MDVTIAGMSILIVQAVWAIALIFMTMYLKGIKRDVEVCMIDTKDCNKSIATIAARQAGTDVSVDNAINRLDAISKRTHDMMSRLVELETRYKVSKGND